MKIPPALGIWDLPFRNNFPRVISVLAFFHAMKNSVCAMLGAFEDLDPTPAPPELIEKAEALVREYDAECFWFRHPDAKVRYFGDIRLVVHHLREYGNWRAWRAAQELQRCL